MTNSKLVLAIGLAAATLVLFLAVTASDGTTEAGTAGDEPGTTEDEPGTTSGGALE